MPKGGTVAFYESIFIIRPDLTTEQVEQVTKRVEGIIAANGGVILRTELWGRRQLAYMVKKNVKGYYVFNFIEGAGSLIANLEARLKIDEDILKFLNVRVQNAAQTPTPLAPNDERLLGVSEDDLDPESDGDDDYAGDLEEGDEDAIGHLPRGKLNS